MNKQHIKHELDLLNIIEHEQVISQAILSRRLGIAAGLVNFLIKRAVSKGIVVAKRVPPKRYAYILTPKGFAEKARLVADYMNTSLGMYRNLRQDFDIMYKKLLSEGRNEIVVVGEQELIELAILSAFDLDIKVKAVVCGKTYRKTIANINVISHIDLIPKDFKNIVYIIVDIYMVQQVYNIFVKTYGPKNVMTPKSLFVVPHCSSAGNIHEQNLT